MPALRTLGAAALALLGSATLLLTAGPGGATAQRAQDVQLVVLPPIVQPGGRAAAADDAKAAFVATVAPATAGRLVALEVRDGDAWRTVATGPQGPRGRVQLAAPAGRAGRPLTYRVRVEPHQDLPAVESDTVSTERWLTPTFSDEFERRTLGKQWQHRGRTYEPQSMRRCSKGSPQAARLEGGVVRLSVIRDPGRSDLCAALKNGAIAGRYAYRLNGHIGTDDGFRFRHGFAAARIRFPALRGQHGAFWMQPVGGMVPGSTGHEIDVVESFGPVKRRSGVFSYIHRYEDGRVVKTGTNVPDTFLHGPRDGWAKNFHVFSVQWTPRQLVFRVDGKETWRIGGRVSQVRQFLILSLLSSDYELPEIGDRRLPQHMDVDWVRVWETGG